MGGGGRYISPPIIDCQCLPYGKYVFGRVILIWASRADGLVEMTSSVKHCCTDNWMWVYGVGSLGLCVDQ